MRSQVELIFHEVADLPAQERVRYFTVHDVDAGTRREVEALIDFDTRSNTALERDIRSVAAQAVSPAVSLSEPEGTLCGPYRLGNSLGAGGMGAVYLAERVDGEVAHRVAVKLLRPGSLDPHLRERFLAERQILAGLSHPNIARLLDAGHRQDGQPYLVMEYIAGNNIDVYTTGLDIRPIVELFLKVCSAVAYLHRNLVVHRDLKPANIMVTTEGEPKLLDFGIAKMLDFGAGSTVTGMRMLTPDYASPEHITGGPITTATDIYSLGAVLYRLLTGVTPRQLTDDSPASIVLAFSSGAITPPSRLVPALKGDLELVLMKALRAEPQERYVSVDAFADDLRACLEWRPVQARSGDAWYRTRRMLRRYWVPAAVAAVIVASLATGTYIANRQRLVAERRFAQLRQLSNRVIDLDRAIRTLPGSVEARQRLVSASLEYLEGLYPDARGNLDLAQEISDGYWRMARIQGVNAEPNLGNTVKAEDSLKKAELLIETVLSARPGDRNALFRSAVIAHDRMILADTDGRRPDLLVHARRAYERLETFLRLDDPSHPVRLAGFLRAGDSRQSERSGAASMYVNIALAYVNIRMYEEGARLARRGAEVAQSIPLAQDNAAQAQSILANALRYQGDLDGSLSAIVQARELAEHAVYPTRIARVFALYGVMLRQGRILGEADSVNLGRPDEAIDVLQKTLDLVEESSRQDAKDTASRTRMVTAARELGNLLRDRDPQRALAVYDIGIQRAQEIKDNVKARRDHAQLLAYSSYPLRRLHRGGEAKARIDAAFAILKDTKDYPAQQIGLGGYAYSVVCALGDQQSESGNLQEALKTYEQLMHNVQAGDPLPESLLADAVTLSNVYARMAALHRRAGQGDHASALEVQRLELWRRWDSKLPNNNFIRRQLQSAGLPADSRTNQPGT